MRHARPEVAKQGQEGAKDRCDSSLQAARRADADQLPHEESEIEAADMDQHSFQNVRVAAKVDAVMPEPQKRSRVTPLAVVA